MSSLEMKQGDTWTEQFQWLNPIPGTFKPDLTNPIDLTGYSARFQIRRSLRDRNTPMLDLTTPTDGLVIDGPNGTVTATATRVQTATVDGGSCYWELEVFNGSNTYTLDEGLIYVERQLT